MSDEFSLGSIEVPVAPLERFEQYLQSRGKRITQQRRLLVSQVFQRHEHFDADELMDGLVKAQGARRVSRPTVYRTLAELIDAGLLRKMVLGGRAVYEHDYGYPQHDHLLCQNCNKLIEFRSDELPEICDSAARKHRFRASGHRLIVSGICHECDKAFRRQRRPSR